MAAKMSVVGKSTLKLNGGEFASGGAKFTTDVVLPGMLHAKILGSTHAHAVVKKVDVSRALKLPGVVAVVTHKDAPDARYNPSAWYPNMLEPKDKRILNQRVRFFGEPVAAVAAVDEDTAEEALGLIDVEYEALPAVFNAEDAMKPGAPKLHRYDRNVAAHVVNEWGDVEKGFKESDYVFEDRYETSRQAHCAMEPHGCLASYQMGKLTVCSGSQIPYKARRTLADIFHIPIHRIRLVSSSIGGAFGGKCDVILEPLCSLLAIKTGRPVKMVLTRDQVFSLTTTRHPAIFTLKTGVKKDGTLVAREIKCVIDTGAYASHGPAVAGSICFEDTGLYRVPNLSSEVYCVYTNNPIAGAFRGYGLSQLGFASECQFDAIAESLGVDPGDFRLKNAIKKGEMDRGASHVLSSYGLDECIAKSSRGMVRNKESPGRDVKIMRGVGMAINKLGSAAAPAIEEFSSAVIKVNEDGTVTLMTGTSDMGQGIWTTLAQIAADVIGVPFGSIKVSSGDTDTSPGDRGAYASGSIYVAGEAVRRAAEDAKTKLLVAASGVMKIKPERLVIVGGMVCVKGKPSVKKLLKEVIPEEPIIAAGTFKAKIAPFSYGAHYVEVEVDAETGQVKVTKAACAHDVGRAVNPMIVEGQIEGAYVQGMGWALVEDTLLDEWGKVANAGFQDYKLYRASDLPEIKSIVVESGGTVESFSARGIGEAGIKPSPPAIANAIYNATGVRLKEMPMNSEKLLRAMKKL